MTVTPLTGEIRAMTIDKYTQRLEKIEVALAQVLPPSADSTWLTAVAGESLVDVRPEAFNDITAPSWALLKRGGKRWRSLVMVLGYELAGGEAEDIYELTTLVELPHTGSLIIDDIEDKAVERRGGPAIHLQFGIDKAINAGNFLYFEPTYLIEQSRLEDSVKLRLLVCYLRVMRRLHFGQGLDIQWHNDHDFIPSRSEYLRMCRYKTGALSRLAAEIAFAAAGRSDLEADAFGRLWEDIGVGFQILDDVKNLVFGNPGKQRGDDIVEGKKSLPVLCHASASPQGGRDVLEVFRRVDVLRAEGKAFQEEVERAIALMEASGAIDEARSIAESLLSRSASLLRSGYPNTEERQSLEELLESFFQGANR